MRKYNAFTVLARIFLVGAVIAVPFGWRDALSTDYADFPLYIWAEIDLHGCVPDHYCLSA